MTIEIEKEPVDDIEEVLNVYEPSSLERRDSMEELNERGCNEIMCQFVHNLDLSNEFFDA
jgi:hypothetical protein